MCIVFFQHSGYAIVSSPLRKLQMHVLNSGSYMSVHVLLNLFNKFGKRDKMEACRALKLLLRNEFNKFNKYRILFNI